MKNFDYNSYHPYGAYSNHSYNNYNNNNNSNSNTCHIYTQQQQQQQPQHRPLTLPLTFPHNHQQRTASIAQHQQQQLQQQQQQQQHQQQHRRQNPQQLLQPHLPTIDQSANTSTSSTSASTSSNNTHNNNNSTGSASFNMQAATYANFYANYNQNHIQNNNHHNFNHNYNEHQHVSNSQQQHQQYHHRNMTANLQELPTSSSASSNAATASIGSSIAADKFTMDACEIANFLANELFMQQLVSVDGIQSGVPTLTTSTLTPTTLRSIEETFTQLISEPINAPYQAGFIPPPLAPFPTGVTSTSTAAPTTFSNSVHDFNDHYETESEDSQGSWSGAQLNEENSMATTDTSSAATDSTSFQNGLNGMGNNSMATSTTSSTNDFTSVNIAIVAAAAAAAVAKNSGSIQNNKNTSNSATTTRRNQGGRRPAKSTNMSPEEEEKRRIRRERNKLAAARCRKRRVDQTNELLEEVAILEKKREGLQKDIENLNTTKQELEYILEAHRPTCQKVRQDLLSVSTYGGLIAPTSSNNSNITGMDATLAATARNSPIDLKPELLPDNMLDVVQHIKNEPLDDTGLDSPCSSLDHDGPPSPKRILLTRKNPMIPPPLPNVATLSPALAAASASLNTPIVTTAPVSFSSFHTNSNTTLNALNTMSRPPHPNGSKQRPNTLPTIPRNLAQTLGLNVDGKPPTDINGVAIQTPSAGMFNFESLMDGGTGLTPVSGPLVPTCSSQNKHPLELTTPTSEPSKLVSL